VARGLDHVAHAVRDLDAAAAFYRRLGFSVGARNRHAPEWGTQNHIVQLPGFFVELLALADVRAIAPHAARLFSFGAFNREFLTRGEGLSFLVLEGHDSESEAQGFRKAGIGDFAVYNFAREAKRPDGTPTQVAFSLAYARDDKAPDIGFFTCRHRHPENFWNSAFQQHVNGVTGIAGAVLVAEYPDDHRRFFTAFAGAAETVSRAGRMTIATPRGNIEVLTPAAFAAEYDAPPPDMSRGMRLAALRFALGDQAVARGVFQNSSIAFVEQGARLVIGPDAAIGATLVFEARG
jgi:catechol 2,3-dioxygenase-like lactoylglutathione lyase family enzyme